MALSRIRSEWLWEELLSVTPASPCHVPEQRTVNPSLAQGIWGWHLAQVFPLLPSHVPLFSFCVLGPRVLLVLLSLFSVEGLCWD